MFKNSAFPMLGLLLCTLTTACSGNTDSQNTATSPEPQAPPTEMVAAKSASDPALQTKLHTAIANYLKTESVPPDRETRFYADFVDLNGDNTQDAIVIFSGPFWCGTGGCTMVVFEGGDQGFQVVSTSSLTRPPLTVSETTTNGWRDLILEVSGGGTPAKTVALKFDGKGYPQNPSDQDALPENTAIQGTVLFPEGSEPQTLPTSTSQSNVQTYDDPVMAIATQYPDDMTVDANCSGEGCGYFFKFKPQNTALDQAEVHIFLPAGAQTTDQAAIGVDELMQSNGWEATPDGTAPAELTYPWVKTIKAFATDREMMGYLFIGETNNQGVRVTLLYPAEMADTFLPAAKLVLDNLRFKADKLPITTQG